MSWTVKTVMTRDVVTVPPDATYKAIAGRLHDHGISALPVVDTNGQVLGIVSEADLLLKEERPAPRPGSELLDRHGDAAKSMARHAAALMKSPAVAVLSSATLRQAASLMHRRNSERLPVVDATGALVGIVSRADLLKAFLRSDASIVHEIREKVLARTPQIDAGAILIEVEEGVVRLAGELETRELARILVRRVAAIEGVVGINDQLRWRLDDNGMRPKAPPQAHRFPATNESDEPSTS
jgi:CBS domain-containing protein